MGTAEYPNVGSATLAPVTTVKILNVALFYPFLDQIYFAVVIVKAIY